MPANDELPRGWSLNAQVQAALSGFTTIQIVLPAVPGVSHVFTKVAASVIGQGSGHGVMAVGITTPWGTGNIGFMQLPGTAANEADSFEWDGVAMLAPGALGNVQYVVNLTGLAYSVMGLYLQVHGYDI